MHTPQLALTGHRGQVTLDELTLEPPPAGHVQVKITHSGISTGTELLTLDTHLESDLQFRMGYQAAGVVASAGEGMADTYKPGDRVACYGGPYVYHASHINVPRHLLTPMPDNVDDRHAAFCGLSSVALHGFRHTGCHIGETVAVIGLGLLGNLAAQCARAAGCRVITSELLPRRVEAARGAGLEVAGSLDELTFRVAALTEGKGADAVMIGVKNADDFMLRKAFELVRRLGKVVILGLADGALPRDVMFAKEATVMVTRAAGWGRYEAPYERDGVDLHYEHARWTEHRNLVEVIRQMSVGGLRIGSLLTDEFAAEDAAQAYEALRNNPAEHLGVTIRW